jgi:hypothetical protein
MFTLCGTS